MSSVPSLRASAVPLRDYTSAQHSATQRSPPLTSLLVMISCSYFTVGIDELARMTALVEYGYSLIFLTLAED